MKLDFEIALDQQTRTGDPAFGEGGGSRPLQPIGAREAATPIFGPNLAQFGPIWPNPLHMAKKQILCAVLVASGPLNSYIKFHPD